MRASPSLWKGSPGGLLLTTTELPFETSIDSSILIRILVIDEDEVSECLFDWQLLILD
jgi:hypothetical protein